ERLAGEACEHVRDERHPRRTRRQRRHLADGVANPEDREWDEEGGPRRGGPGGDAADEVRRPEPQAGQPRHVPRFAEVVGHWLAEPRDFLRPGGGAFEDGEVVVAREQEEHEAEDHRPDEGGHENECAKVHRRGLERCERTLTGYDVGRWMVSLAAPADHRGFFTGNCEGLVKLGPVVAVDLNWGDGATDQFSAEAQCLATLGGTAWTC